MSRNEGTLDRVLRVIVGLVLIALALTGTLTPWGMAFFKVSLLTVFCYPARKEGFLVSSKSL